MDSLALFSVLFIFMLLISILQAVTLRSVRSASRNGYQIVNSAIQVGDSNIESTCSDSAKTACEPSGTVENRARCRTQTKTPLWEVKKVEEDHSGRNGKKRRRPVTDPQWQWLSFLKLEGRHGDIEREFTGRSGLAQTDDDPFKVYYHRRERILWPDMVEVLITSPSLIRILKRYLPEHDELASLDDPKLNGRDLYIVLESLKCHAFKARAKSFGGENLSNLNHASSTSESQSADKDNCRAELSEGMTKEPGTNYEAPLGVLHIKHLVRFLEKEYKDVAKKESHMRKEKRVAWDMLWTFLRKGVKVGYYCEDSEELLCAVVASSYYYYSSSRKTHVFKMNLDVWDFDGLSYKPCTITRKIDRFHYERQFSELAVCPIEILEDPSDLDGKLLANGREFFELVMKSANRFMVYEGPMYARRRPPHNRSWKYEESTDRNYGSSRVKGWEDLHKEKGDGRVMIDLYSFATMNPNYPMGNARPPKRRSHEFRGLCLTRKGFSASSCCKNDVMPVKAMPKHENSSVRGQEEVFEEDLIFAPAIVYGFSFKLNKWGCFAVSGFSNVAFDRESFQELTMEPAMKSMVCDLVRQYVSSNNDYANSSERVDPIAEKGEGCIVLCHGPPGTGKTLTAESLAEHLERPLWAMSIKELGTTPAEVEWKLSEIMNVAARWKAVLLLDEADVYLEKRIDGRNVSQNAITGVFLRRLEYYRGVLFLTTNRIGKFDAAFRSRISLFLHYCELGLAEKERIWKTLLTRAKAEGVTDEFCKEMAAQNLNGREIRNAIHTAKVWANSKGERLAVTHIQYFLGVQAIFLTALDKEAFDARETMTIKGPPR